MTVSDKLQAVVDGIESVRQAVEAKGATLPPGSGLGEFPAAVESIDTAWVPLPPADTSSLSNLFRGWSWLESAPPLDTSLVTNMSYMFSSCTSLVEVPPLDTSSVTNMSYMFHDCTSLTEVPPLDTSSVTSMSYTFSSCTSLVEVALADCSKVTLALNMFGSTATDTQAASLERLILPGLTRGFNMIGTNMGAAALNDLFDSLGTASGSQTINITGAPGAATCDKSIATAKGWTITG